MIRLSLPQQLKAMCANTLCAVDIYTLPKQCVYVYCPSNVYMSTVQAMCICLLPKQCVYIYCPSNVYISTAQAMCICLIQIKLCMNCHGIAIALTCVVAMDTTHKFTKLWQTCMPVVSSISYFVLVCIYVVGMHANKKNTLGILAIAFFKNVYRSSSNCCSSTCQFNCGCQWNCGASVCCLWPASSHHHLVEARILQHFLCICWNSQYTIWGSQCSKHFLP